MSTGGKTFNSAWENWYVTREKLTVSLLLTTLLLIYLATKYERGFLYQTILQYLLGVLQFNSVLTLAQRECPTLQIRARSHRTAPTADSSHRSRWSTVHLTTQLSAVGSHNPLLRSDEFTSVVHRAQENILLTSLTQWM